MIFGVIFLSLGFLLWFWGNRISEFELSYHEVCKDKKPPLKCPIEFELDQKFKSPTFVYYQLDNLFQNHRRYVRSRENWQLRGNQLSTNDISECYPIITNGDLGFTHSVDKTPLDPEAPAHP